MSSANEVSIRESLARLAPIARSAAGMYESWAVSRDAPVCGLASQVAGFRVTSVENVDFRKLDLLLSERTEQLVEREYEDLMAPAASVIHVDPSPRGASGAPGVATKGVVTALLYASALAGERPALTLRCGPSVVRFRGVTPVTVLEQCVPWVAKNRAPDLLLAGNGPRKHLEHVLVVTTPYWSAVDLERELDRHRDVSSTICVFMLVHDEELRDGVVRVRASSSSPMRTMFGAAASAFSHLDALAAVVRGRGGRTAFVRYVHFESVVARVADLVSTWGEWTR